MGIRHGVSSSQAPLLSNQSTNPARTEPRQRGQIRISRPDLDPSHVTSRDPSLPARSESPGSIRIRMHAGIRVYLRFGFGPFVLPYVPATMATGRRPTTVTRLKGVRVRG
jgi:hypothetical protein